MAEIAGRMVDDELFRMPAANSYKLYYTAISACSFAMEVCNGEGSDAHVSVWVIGSATAWVDGAAPPPFTVVHKNQRVEADGTDGNFWPMPARNLNLGDRVVVRTDLVGVTFLGHGFRFTS